MTNQSTTPRTRASATRASTPPAARSYGASAKGLHWLIALLVVTQFVVSILMPDIGPNTAPATLIKLHISFGLSIVLLMAIRVVHRRLHPVGLEMPGALLWERWTAHATHVAFYAILLVVPFLGWASASAHKLPVTLFGIVRLPDIAAPRARWALAAGDVHAYAMWVLLALIGLHVLAALYHYFVRHDGVLERMLPRRV